MFGQVVEIMCEKKEERRNTPFFFFFFFKKTFFFHTHQEAKPVKYPYRREGGVTLNIIIRKSLALLCCIGGTQTRLHMSTQKERGVERLIDFGFDRQTCEIAMDMSGAMGTEEEIINKAAELIMSGLVPTELSPQTTSSRDTDEDVKMMLVVRTDLRMSIGKIVAQTAHAAVSCSKSAEQDFPLFYTSWFNTGMAKIAVSVDSESILHELQSKAHTANIPSYLVRDAGRTEVASNTPTVLAIGPAPVSVVDLITRHLSLLK